VALSRDGDDNSITQSGISQATVTITDDEGQQALTGQDAVTTVASINREVNSEQVTSNSLAPIFDEREIESGFEITRAFTQEVGTFLSNRARESAQAQEALEIEQAKPENEQDLQRIAQLMQTVVDNSTFEAGGTGRRIITAVTAAVSGNVSGADILQGAAVNFLQSLAVTEVKKIADELDSDTARAVLQAIVGCAGASAQGQSCSAGATGAASAVVLNKLIDNISGVDGSELSQEEKEQRLNIVNGIIAGIAVGADLEVSTALTTAKITAENNDLNFIPKNEVKDSDLGNTVLTELANKELAKRNGENSQELVSSIAKDTNRPIEDRIEEINSIINQNETLQQLDFDVSINNKGEIVFVSTLNNFFEDGVIDANFQREEFKASIDSLEEGQVKTTLRVFFAFFDDTAEGTQQLSSALRKNPGLLIDIAEQVADIVDDAVTTTSPLIQILKGDEESKAAELRTLKRIEDSADSFVKSFKEFEQAAADGDIDKASRSINPVPLLVGFLKLGKLVPDNPNLGKFDVVGDTSGFNALGVVVDPKNSQQGRLLIQQFRQEGSSIKVAELRARSALQTGETLPVVSVAKPGEKFFKLVPESSTRGPSNVTEFFIDQKQLDDLLSGKPINIGSEFGLPNKTSANSFKVFEVTVKDNQAPLVFRSKIAPVIDDGIVKEGGKVQALLPKRSAFTEPKQVDINGEPLIIRSKLGAVNDAVQAAPDRTILKSTAANNVGQFEKLKTDLARQELLGAIPTGSALKGSGPFSPRTFNSNIDITHSSPTFARDLVNEGRHFTIKGNDGVERNLTQVLGEVNGVKGVFEFIVDPNPAKGLTHQRFIEGGVITGSPNQVVK